MGNESEVRAQSLVFRLVAAGLAFAAVFFGAPALFHHLRESQAVQIAGGSRSPGTDGNREIARLLAAGYEDTAPFREYKHYLEPKDPAPYVGRNIVEEKKPISAAIAALLAFLATYEASRVFARKRLAERQISNLPRNTGRF